MTTKPGHELPSPEWADVYGMSREEWDAYGKPLDWKAQWAEYGPPAATFAEAYDVTPGYARSYTKRHDRLCACSHQLQPHDRMEVCNA